MGLFKDDTGKTEKPTPGRLAEAANKGQVPISKEFTMAGTLLIAVLFLMTAGRWLIDAMSDLMEHGLQVDLRRHHIGTGSTTDAMHEINDAVAPLTGPLLSLFAVALVATIVVGYGQIGIKLRSEALKLKFERMNPVTNLNKLFNLSSVMRTVLSALKLLVLGGVLWLVVRKHMPEFAMMYDLPLEQSVGIIVDTAFEILLWVSLVILALSIGDIAWQRFDHVKNLKMSKQEIDDERKRTDGDPQIKARLRRAALDIMRQRMMEAIPHADVVITNPTHYSVALAYQRGKNRAPEVVAKGVDELALKIREIARENDVPFMEDPPLARALFRGAKVGQEIPERFYRAVAAVLSQVYRLREGAA